MQAMTNLTSRKATKRGRILPRTAALPSHARAHSETTLDVYDYTANALNQYTQISNLCDSVTLCDDLVPQYDLDGNQTLVKTSTGVWQVSYNGENRPVSWTCGTTNIVMAYDRMGRRVLSRETVGGAVTDSNFSFVYDGYLCIQRLNATTRNVKLIFTWDPLEKVATRPLMVEKPGKYKMHVTHDGNKNVSELVFFSGGSGIAAHYEYAPFGALTASTRSTSVTAYDLRTYNPFRFSSGIARGTVPSEFSYIDDCVVQIRVEINLNIELENKVQKGDLYVYWPHSTSIHSGYQGVTSTEAKSHRRPPKGSVLAHELGHAEVFVTMTKPRFENDISSYLSKNSLTSEEQNEVIDLFSQAKRDALGESYKRANANTVLWFQTHDFSVTRRRNGNLKPTVGDEYEFIKR